MGKNRGYEEEVVVWLIGVSVCADKIKKNGRLDGSIRHTREI